MPSQHELADRVHLNVDALRAERDRRRREPPLSRSDVLWKLAGALKNAARSPAPQMALMYLSEASAEHEPHGLHLEGGEIKRAIERWSGCWTRPIGETGETPQEIVVRRMRALLEAAKADRFFDRSSLGIIAEAVDRFGLDTVLSHARLDDYDVASKRQINFQVEVQAPSISVATAREAALALLTAADRPEAA